MGENICTIASDNGLITRICKELRKTNHNKGNNPVKKWAKDLKTLLSKAEIQMADRKDAQAHQASSKHK